MKNYTILLTTLYIFFATNAHSQVQQYTYYLNEKLASTEKTKAIIVGKGIKEKNLFRLDCFHRYNNNLMMTLHFTDSTISNLQGSFISYHQNGRKENLGNFLNGYEEGLWQTWDTSGRKKDSILYKDGYALKTAKFEYDKNDQLNYYSFNDSLPDTFETFNYDSTGKISHRAIFKGSKGILFDYTGAVEKKDSVFTRDEIEADFPGGKQRWVTFLKMNLNANVPVDNNAPEGTYTVIVRFIVKVDGTIDDIKAETNHGYGMEREVIRIIDQGPKWLPAVQYGRRVNAYRRQPVTFVINETK